MTGKMSLEHVANEAARVFMMVLKHPVELIVLLHTMLAVIDNESGMWLRPAPYAPFAVAAALCLRLNRERRWTRWAYWAVLPLYALCVLLPEGWYRTPEMGILYSLIAPAYLLVRKGNGSARLFSMVRSAAVAMGVGMLTCLLLMLILASISLLFDSNSDYYTHILAFSFVLLAPMVFIGMESGGDEPTASRLEEALLNWVVTPALLIYNVVLYVYMVTILVRWDLPKGSVATMVTAFIAVLMGVSWLRPMLAKRPLEWYFRWSWLLALPLVALFWVAVGYRIGQYGLTIDRCTLIAIGAAITVYVVAAAFRQRNTDNQRLIKPVCLLAVVLGLLLAFAARPLSIHSQTAVARHYAAVAGVLADDGTIQFEAIDKADATFRAEHRHVYQAMKYIEKDLRDTAAVQQRLGMTSKEYAMNLSPSTADYARAYVVDRYGEDTGIEDVIEEGHYIMSKDDGVLLNLNDYSRMYVNVRVSDGEIKLGDITIPADSVLAVQLASIGYKLESDLNKARLEAYEEQLCIYHSPDGRILIIFDDYHIEHRDDGNHMDHGRINCALVK